MRSFVLAMAALALIAAAPAPAADPAVDAHYRTLLASAKTVDPAEVDWQALRFAYADSSSFDLMGEHTDAARRAMFEALNKDDDKTVIDEANKILDADFVDIDAHVALDLAYQATGQSALSTREHQIALGLLKSVHTGDGTTPEQAFTVISVGEEYATMRAFALSVTGQALIETPPHSYDRLTVTDGAGKTHTIFFRVDRVMAAESALMKGGK
jgi:hypothetical protein